MALPNLLTVDNDFLPSNALEVHILCRIMLDLPPAATSGPQAVLVTFRLFALFP